MNSIAKFDHCFGCGVCTAICPKEAISMVKNEAGFFSPVVSDACVNCSLCLQVCSFNLKNELRLPKVVASYAGWSNNAEVRDLSTSGGIITELSTKLLQNGYKIFAVRYNYTLKISEYFIVDSIADWSNAQGSKYIQAYSFDALKQIDFQQKYLVVGVPCFISSFRSLIQKKKVENNFILLDFFCHGVPSYLMWDKYLQIIENQTGDVSFIKWRNKDNGWQDSVVVKAKGRKGRYLSFLSKGDLFFNFFLRDLCLNQCCYEDCVFKQCNSSADIRVGDFWGSRYTKNQLGVNSILTLTPLGDRLLNELETCELFKEDLDTTTRGQLHVNPKRPKSFSYVMKALKTNADLKRIYRKADRYKYISLKFYQKQLLRIINRVKRL